MTPGAHPEPPEPGPGRRPGPAGAPAWRPRRDLLDSFFPTLGRWQDGRALWLAGGLFALGLEIFSVLWFQKRLGLSPCEYCVRIRLDMWLILLGGLVAAAMPRALLLKLAGWLLAFGASAAGLRSSWLLERINVRSLHVPGSLGPCRPGKADFILGLRFDAWFPLHFRPDGICGQDSLWFLWGLSMTQWLIIFFAFALGALSLVAAAAVLRRVRSGRA
jgi:disulfide bond formation protein DsbB